MRGHESREPRETIQKGNMSHRTHEEGENQRDKNAANRNSINNEFSLGTAKMKKK